MADEKEKKKKCRELAVTPVDDFHWHSDGNSRGLLYAFFRFAERSHRKFNFIFFQIYLYMENYGKLLIGKNLDMVNFFDMKEV